MLVIDSYEQLNALLRLLWTVKFDMPPEDSLEFSASPYIAEIYLKTYQPAIDVLRKKYLDGEAYRLEQGLTGQHTFEIQAIERHIEFLKDEWITWGLEKKRNFVRLSISPFILS